MLGGFAKGAWSLTKFGIGNPGGRVMTGGLVGGLYNAATGTEGYATDRFIIGAATGAAITGAAHIGLSKTFIRGVGRTVAPHIAQRGFRGIGAQMGSYAKGMDRLAGAIANPYLWATVTGAATLGSGAYLYANVSAQQRVNKLQQGMYSQRFMRSTDGLVQGAHAGRHR